MRWLRDLMQVRRKRMKTQLLVTSVLVLFTGVARANDTAIWGVGGAIRPMQEHPSIVMENMDLRVDIYPEIGRARCDYVLHNIGPATTVRMGFPETVTGPRAGRPRGFLSFATTVDGHAVPARVEGVLVRGAWDTTRWRVKTVRFRAGQRRRIQVSYTSELGITLTNKQRRVFSYKIQTGASWKGPIGSVRVRVFGHYDPNRNWLEAGPQFRQTGPTSFEWSTRNLEPKEELYFRYYGDDIALTLSGRRVHWLEYRGTYAYIRDGQAWLQVRMAAEALRAEVEARAGEVVLTRGARVVRLRPGSRAMVRNGEAVRMAKAPYVRRGRLMVPLRPVAVALGAQVTFDARRRLTDLSATALQEPMYRELLDHSSLLAQLQGYAPPELSEFDPAMAASTSRPWVCTGDFDGNGIPDAAFLLRNGDELRAGALVRYDRSWTFVWLPHREQVAMRPGSVRTVLQLRKPGEVVGWTPDDAKQPLGPLALAHDSIELVIPGKPTVLCYWDAQVKQLRSGTVVLPPVVEEAEP
jgi:hypothetical protein